MAHGILITGPVGVGKTTTLHEIEAVLEVPNAILDLDWLAWARPARGTAHDLMLRNLADVWRNIHAAGIAHELRERIRRRDTGTELEEHLALVDRWQPVGADAVIPVDGKAPAQVARDVLGAAGWPLPTERQEPA